LLFLFLVVFRRPSEQGVDGDLARLPFLVVLWCDMYGAALRPDFHCGSLSAPLTWLQSQDRPACLPFVE
jgi:hypothetical protein